MAGPAARSPEGFKHMSVGNELSSEVAVTLLEVEGAVNPHDLEEVLALLRSTMRALSSEERGRRRAKLILGRKPGPTLSANRGAN